jgi:hypothetical protein
MLGATRARLASLSKALLERETLDEDDAYRAAGFEPGKAPAQLEAGGDGRATTAAPEATRDS